MILLIIFVALMVAFIVGVLIGAIRQAHHAHKYDGPEIL